MGNHLATPARPAPAIDLVAEVPNVVFKEALGGGRLLKSMLCIHDDAGLVVVKVYQKRGDTGSLRRQEQQLKEVRDRLARLDFPHVLPVAEAHETARGAYLLRPHAHASVAARLGTRPFLAAAEKRWVAFQVLHALAAIHAAGVVHGDLKPENVLLTSGGWVLLADFAPFKPGALPADNPADFTFFFESGGSRRCSLAPERFVDGGVDASCATKPVDPASDVFAAGCLLAEVFADGRPVFDLSGLLAYRRGEPGAGPDLTRLDADARALVAPMLALDPAHRPSASACLAILSTSLFPPHRALALHGLCRDQLALDADGRVAALARAWPGLRRAAAGDGLSVDCGDGGREEVGVDGGRRPLLGGDVGRAKGGTLAAAAPDPATPPPSAPPTLLRDVGALLADTEGLLARLRAGAASGAASLHAAAGGEGGAHGDDAFFCDDGGEEDGAEHWDAQGQPRSDTLSPPPPAPAAIGEVAADAVFEVEFRERDGAFAPAPAAALPGGLATARKQDVRLPPGGGWQWAGDWAVDGQAWPCDADGWAYAAAAGGGRAPSDAWSPMPSEGAAWRRRRWTRARRRVAASGVRGGGRRRSDDAAPDLDAGDGDPHHPGSDIMVILTILLCSLVRGARSTDARARAVALLAAAAARADDDARLQRAVPYLLAMASDPAARVRCAALRALARVVGAVRSLPPSDARVFSEYILPSLSSLPSDPDEVVRVQWARVVVPLALEAARLVSGDGGGGRGGGEAAGGNDGAGAAAADTGAAASQAGPAVAQASPANPAAAAAEAAAVLASTERAVHDLAVGPASSSAARRALLPHLGPLAALLGRAQANDALLPVAITFLNDRDWRLRSDFFRHVGALAAAAGPAGLEAFLLPCLEQALGDGEPAVVAAAVAFLARAADARALRRRALLACARRVLPRLLEPAEPAVVRAAAARFAAAAARSLSPAEAHSLLAPLVAAGTATPPARLDEAADVGASLAPGPVPDDGGVAADPAPIVIATAAPLLRAPTGAPDAAAPDASALANALAAAGVPDGADAAEAAGRRYFATPSEALAPLSTRVTPAGGGALAAGRLSLFGLGPVGGGVGGLSPDDSSAQPGQHLLGAAITAAVDAELPTHAADAARARAATPWRPRGTPVAHLAEHTRAVHAFAVPRSGRFFVSASADGTARLWDAAALERDASQRSRGVYGGQGGRLVAASACWDDDCVATGSSEGSVHVWRAAYAGGAAGGVGGGGTAPSSAPPRVTGLEGVRDLAPGDGPVGALADWGRLLLYSSLRGGVRAWDPRAPRDAWALAPNPRDGMVTALAPDPGGGDWLLTGSSRGALALWDARLLLAVCGWMVPGAPPVAAAAAATAPRARLGVRGDPPVGPLVWVAAGGEAGLWDAAASSVRLVLRVAADGRGAVARPTTLGEPPRLGAALGNGGTPMSGEDTGIRCLLPTGAGPVVSGSTDGVVRLWDGARPEESYAIAGVPGSSAWAGEGDGSGAAAAAASPAPATPLRARVYARRLVDGVAVLDEAPCAAAAPPPPPPPGPGLVEPAGAAALAHRDAVTALAEVEGRGGARLLLSASRDGVVKAWK